MQRIHLVKRQESLSKTAVLYNVESGQVRMGVGKIDGFPYHIISGIKDGAFVIENFHRPFVLRMKEDFHQQISALGLNIQEKAAQPDEVVLVEQTEGKKHIVRPLEKLDDIAKFYATDKKEILRANNLKTEKLYIGQILWI